ncbi:MAG: redox-sensing transcriptional repressor Rex [Phycisphaerae bacterium]|nr:redox-sensing transcriptional repressor Rex [Phycisphaerae bacterium]
MKADHIPAPAVKRLSLYLRELENLQRGGRTTVSSRRLGDALGLTDAQVRKDLAYFGQFGHPGIGYDITELSTEIRRILGTDRTWNILLVGAGNLGTALAAYRGFSKRGFHLVAVFDSDPRKIGRPVPSVESITIQPLGEIAKTVKQYDVRLAIISVPAEAAQQVADLLVEAGVRGVLNFAPTALTVPSEIAVSAVDMAVQLEQLSFQLGMMQRLPARSG